MKKVLLGLMVFGLLISCVTSPEQETKSNLSEGVTAIYHSKDEWDTAGRNLDIKLENAVNSLSQVGEMYENGEITESEADERSKVIVGNIRQVLTEKLSWVEYGNSNKFINSSQYQELLAENQTKSYFMDLFEEHLNNK